MEGLPCILQEHHPRTVTRQSHPKFPLVRAPSSFSPFLACDGNCERFDSWTRVVDKKSLPTFPRNSAREIGKDFLSTTLGSIYWF